MSRLNARGRQLVAWSAVVVIGGLWGLALVASPHWAVAIALATAFSVLGLARPDIAIPALLVYATVLGFLRRALAHYLDTSPSVDPLILVVPVATIVLGAMAIRRGALRDRSLLGNTVLVLLVLAVVGAFNPQQGSLSVGLSGLVFLGVPFLWFFVGRSLCPDNVLGRSYRWVAVVVIASSVYGLAQSAGRFTSFDREWGDSTGFRLGGEVRPFGWSSSPGEYSRMLAVAALIVLVLAAARRLGELRWIVVPAALVLLGSALILSSIRSTVVYLVLAVAVVAAARGRTQIGPTLVAGAAALVVLMAVATLAGPTFQDATADNVVLSRQIEGLSNPADSTATARFELLGRALGDAVDQPIGLGTGVTTRAAAQGDQRVVVTESDIGDAAVSWGLPGVVAIVVLVIAGLLTLIRLVGVSNTWLAQAALGVFIIATLRWTNGGLYPLAPLTLLGLGWADQRYRSLRRAPSTSAADTTVPSPSAAPQ